MKKRKTQQRLEFRRITNMQGSSNGWQSSFPFRAVQCLIVGAAFAVGRFCMRKNAVARSVLVPMSATSPAGERLVWDEQNLSLLQLWEIAQWAWLEPRRITVDLTRTIDGRRRYLTTPPTQELRKAFNVEDLGTAWPSGDLLPSASNNPIVLGKSSPTAAEVTGTSLPSSECQHRLAVHRTDLAKHANGPTDAASVPQRREVLVSRIRDVFITFEGIVFDESRGMSALNGLGFLTSAYWPVFENTFGVTGLFYDSILASAANPHAGRDADETDAIKWEVGYFAERSSVRRLGSGCGVPVGDAAAPCNSGIGAVVSVPHLLAAATCYGLNYFHFLTESGLFQLLAFKATGMLARGLHTILIYDTPFMRQALHMLGVVSDVSDETFKRSQSRSNGPNILFMEPDEVYFAHELYFVDSGLAPVGHLPATQGTLRAVRQRVLELVPSMHLASELNLASGGEIESLTSASASHRLLYIRREPGVERSISNEASVIEMLRDEMPVASILHVFEASTTDKVLTLAQQVRLFQAATVAIGVHGAALSNVLWMHADTSVVYFAPADATDAMGGTLGDMRLYACGANDFWLLASAAAARFYAVPAFGDHNSPLSVDLASFRKLVTSGGLFPKRGQVASGV